MDEVTLHQRIVEIERELATLRAQAFSIDNPTVWHCNDCGEVKTIAEFKRMSDGKVRPYCRSCFSARGKAYLATLSEEDRRRLQSSSSRSELEQQRKLARTRLAEAIRYGKFPRANTQKCSVCGEQAEDYHHANGYNAERWDDVVPVCRVCHGGIHRKHK